MRTALVAAFALVACDPGSVATEDHGPTVARVFVSGPMARSDEAAEIVREAGEHLDAHLVVVDESEGTYGSLLLTIVPYPEGEVSLYGRTHLAGGPDPICYRSSWCYADPVVCAHEIGHMLGLEESSTGGLMDSSAVVNGGTTNLRFGEREEIRERANDLAACATL